MVEMDPRQRVMITLNRGLPDRVPWVENAIDEPMQIEIMEGTDFTPGDLCRKLGLDGFGGTFPIQGRDAQGNPFERYQGVIESYYYPDKVNFDFFNNFITESCLVAELNRSFLGQRLLKDEASMELFKEYQPDPHHPERYKRVAEWINRYRENFAVFARLDIGTGPTIQSMGLQQFSYTLADNPRLIHQIHGLFSEWSATVIRYLNELDFDFYWVMDDLAWNRAPFISPRTFREFLLPHMREAAKEIKKPWVFHSDGNILPLLDDLLTLGMNAIHPIQPGAMDIQEIKKVYGDKICLIGNIDLNHTLTLGLPEEVEEEVRNRIYSVAPGGGYIISSAMTLTDYCKKENILSMSTAVKKYGKYPITHLL